MSNTSQGPGWWLASDGRWYPPETRTVPGGPAPQPYRPATNPGTPLPSTGYPHATGPVPGYGVYPGAGYRPPAQTNGLAVASLVCSCVGIIIFGIPCILGVIFGFIARGQIRRSHGTQSGGGLAMAGIIVGMAFLALFVLGIIFIFAFAHNFNCTTVNGYTHCTNNT